MEKATATLNNGVAMPQLGLGVFQVGDQEASAAVATALECGYRSIDTAKLYFNATGSNLSQKFKEIADELSNLRIVG